MATDARAMARNLWYSQPKAALVSQPKAVLVSQHKGNKIVKAATGKAAPYEYGKVRLIREKEASAQSTEKRDDESNTAKGALEQAAEYSNSTASGQEDDFILQLDEIHHGEDDVRELKQEESSVEPERKRSKKESLDEDD